MDTSSHSLRNAKQTGRKGKGGGSALIPYLLSRPSTVGTYPPPFNPAFPPSSLIFNEGFPLPPASWDELPPVTMCPFLFLPIGLEGTVDPFQTDVKAAPSPSYLICNAIVPSTWMCLIKLPSLPPPHPFFPWPFLFLSFSEVFDLLLQSQ